MALSSWTSRVSRCMYCVSGLLMLIVRCWFGCLYRWLRWVLNYNNSPKWHLTWETKTTKKDGWWIELSKLMSSPSATSNAGDFDSNPWITKRKPFKTPFCAAVLLLLFNNFSIPNFSACSMFNARPRSTLGLHIQSNESTLKSVHTRASEILKADFWWSGRPWQRKSKNVKSGAVILT